jgi:hypothetical protein
MGVDTYFEGSFKLDKPLKPEHLAYLKRFSETRRMKRDVSQLQDAPDPIREATGLPLGPEGGYFVAGDQYGIGDPTVVDRNEPPQGQPGLWCQWIPTEDGKEIVWDKGEKFYWHAEWLRYLIEFFLDPWGYALDGEIQWKIIEEGFTAEGEYLVTHPEHGTIRVKSNVVEVVEGDDQTLPEDDYGIQY